MSFFIRDYTSEEKFDISKFLEFNNGVYDALNSPFLSYLKQLPVMEYYNVDDGYKEIDMIAASVYGDSLLAYLIQFYNGDFRNSFPEGTVLNLFSLEDLNELYFTIENRQQLADKGE